MDNPTDVCIDGNPEPIAESVGATPLVDTWAAMVHQRFQERCSGCGGENRLQARLVVPEHKGGQKTVENAVLLCFSCDNASELGGLGGQDNDRMVDVHVSRRLCEWVHSWPERGLFTTMSAGMRKLMSLFLENPRRFPDLERYQDPDPAEPKINFWVNRDFYILFQREVRELGVTVKDALIALVLIFEESLEKS